jgi:hypothetical protein
MTIIKFLIISFLIIISTSCAVTSKVNTFNNFAVNKLQYKDSVYLVFTAKAWAKVNFDVYNDDLLHSNEATRTPFYKVLRAFYSPDSLKIIGWVEKKMENGHGCDRPQGFSYSATSIIGFRDNVKKPWNLYPFNLTQAVCFDTQDVVLNQMGKYYFQKMKDHSEYVNKKFLDPYYGGKVRYDVENQVIKMGYGDKNAPVIGKNFGYNLQDKDFWTKSLIWQKGARIPGLYNFQTKGNVMPDQKDIEVITPKITYPDSILRMYR